MTTDLRTQVLDALDANTVIKAHGSSHLIRLPFALADGHIVQVEATRVSGDVWTLSDRGQAAISLWESGVDLTSGAPSRSWTALLRTLNLPPAVVAPSDPYVLTMSSTDGSVGVDVVRLGEAVLLADGLRALRRPAGKSRLRNRILAAAGALPDVGVLPGAKLETRFGGAREVTAKLTQLKTDRILFAQGVSTSTGASYDHARALFSDADVPAANLVVVVAADASLDGWQRKALNSVAAVIDEQDMPEAFAEILAA